MNRSECRETIFKLLFVRQFSEQEEMREQVQLYLDSLREGREEVPYGSSLSDADADYITKKTDAVISEIPEIDGLLSEVSEGWKISRMNKVDLTILRLAVYELLRDEEIPTGVAINEAVELAKRYGGDDSSSFVNGILGKIARRTEAAEGSTA